jgi:hypothetical protein
VEELEAEKFIENLCYPTADYFKSVLVPPEVCDKRDNALVMDR